MNPIKLATDQPSSAKLLFAKVAGAKHTTPQRYPEADSLAVTSPKLSGLSPERSPGGRKSAVSMETLDMKEKIDLDLKQPAEPLSTQSRFASVYIPQLDPVMVEGSEPLVSAQLNTITEAESLRDSAESSAPGSSKSKLHNRYLDLVAREGWNLFHRATNETSSKEADDSDLFHPFPTEMRNLTATPSMLMLTEAAELLSESQSAFIPMEAESTGGVYQLRRQKSFAISEEQTVTNESAAPSIFFGGRPRFFNSKKKPEAGHPSKTAAKSSLQEVPLTASVDPPRQNEGSPVFAELLGRSGRSRSFTVNHPAQFSARQQNQSAAGLRSGKSGLSKRTTMSTYSIAEESNPLTSDTEKPLPISPLLSAITNSNSDPTLRRLSSSPLQLYKTDPGPIKVIEGNGPAPPLHFVDPDSARSLESSGSSETSLSSDTSATIEIRRPALRTKKVSRLAVFKPEDEETGSKAAARVGDRNPDRAGLIVGGGAKRERAAYILDKNVGRFSGVPETALVMSKLPLKQQSGNSNAQDGASSLERYQMKRGSLQRYCESDGSAEDRPDLVMKASPRQVHGIGILDLRIMQTDRHSGNILCRKDSEDGSVKLIPIDHGLSLPDWHFLAEAYFDWQYWAQADTAFDAETLAVIENIDVEQDAAALRDLGFPEGCVATNKLCTLALKAGARHGLHLKDLGKIFQRPFCAGHNLHNKFFSPLEHMVIDASKRCGHEYFPSGTIESNELFENVGRQKSCDDEELDIDDLETMAYGNMPPPPEFYGAFEQVLEEHCSNGRWRDLLHI